MNKFICTLFGSAFCLLASAQQKEGKIIYERSMQLQLMINNGGGDQPMARTRTDKFELNFAEGKMSFKALDEDLPEDSGPDGGNGGLIIRTIGASPDDIVFCDFNQGRKLEQREFFDKKYLIADSLRRGSWKLTDETSTILNHLCRKATTQRTGKRMIMSMTDGKMERKEIDDTTTVTAWFTTDIPVSISPEAQGQLPGAILALETNNGRTTFRAIQISDKPDLSAIKEPTKGKKLSVEEFDKERSKMMDEMQRNNRGGNFRVRAD